jgi:hypothetical protein
MCDGIALEKGESHKGAAQQFHHIAILKRDDTVVLNTHQQVLKCDVTVVLKYTSANFEV